MRRNLRFIVVAVAVVVGLSACASSVPVQSVGSTSTTSTTNTTTTTTTTTTTVNPSELPPPLAVPETPWPAQSGPVVPDGEGAAVEDVVDGDTIVVAGGTRVRLIGIDTPETKDPRKPVQCFGAEASAYTASLLPPGTPVRLVFDVERFDRFGRTLAYVYREADGLFVNVALVANGYAQVATFPPNVAHADELTVLARTAREEGRGLWSACDGESVPGGTAAPPAAPAAPPAVSGNGSCDVSYPDVCIPAVPPDLDCGDISERRFRVLPPDPHRFDGSDDDGLGCEN